MRWHAQVLHVAQKDVRLTKWSLVLYACAVALITALTLAGVMIWGQVLWVGGLCIIGALVLGMFVHADSPSRVDAFWATRPLSASAVYTAKVVGAVLLLALPAIGELLVLAAHDIGMTRALVLLGRPTAAYGALLATSIMVAVLTPTLRLFVAGFIALFVVESVAASLLPWWLSNEEGILPSSLLYVLSVGGLIALGAWQYITRTPRRGMVLGALLVALMLLIPASMLEGRRTPRAASTIPADSVELRVEVQELRRAGQRWIMPLRLTLQSTVLDRYYGIYIEDVYARIGEEWVELPNPPVYLQDARTRLDGITWLNADSSAVLSLDLTNDMRERLRGSDVRIVVHANVIAHTLRVLVDVPLETGATIARGGHRMHIARVQIAPTLEIELRHSMVPVQGDAEVDEGDRFELINEQRGEALALTTTYWMNAQGALVLPASHGRIRDQVLTAARLRSGARPFEPDAAWLAQARLRYVRVLGERHYRASAEAALPRE